MIDLYPDQKQWCRAVVESFERPQPNGEGPFTKVISQAATGAGKTTMSAALIEYALKRWPRALPGGHARAGQPCRVLFIADSDELVSQAQAEIYEFNGRPTDREKAEDRASLHSEVVVGSMQTLGIPARRERFPRDHFTLVIVDEAHCSMADTWQAVMNYFHEGGAMILGVTATPERGDDRDLWDWWQHKAAELGLFELIALGRLAPIKVKTVPLELDCRGIKKTKEGLDEEQLAEAIRPSFEAIIEAWEVHGEGRKTLWFLPGVPASKLFTEILVERGHAARHIDGQSKDRREILQGYKENLFDHLVNANLLIKGYNQRDIACVVNLAPGKSRVSYQQKVGRGTRTWPGKDYLLLLDFLWQFDKLGIVRPVDLVARTDKEAQRMQEMLDQQARQSDRLTDAQKEEMGIDLHDARDIADNLLVQILVKQLVNNTSRATRVYDASAAAAVINAPELLIYEPQAPWEKEKPSAKQLSMLEKLGVKTSTVKTKGYASALIEKLKSRMDGGLSTLKQASRLTAAGVEGAHAMTMAQASEQMDLLIQRTREAEAPAGASQVSPQAQDDDGPPW